MQISGVHKLNTSHGCFFGFPLVFLTHTSRIHVWYIYLHGIFTYIYHKNHPNSNVGKYTSPMDPLGYIPGLQAVVDHCRIEAVIQTGDPNAIPQCSSRLDRYWSSIPQSIWVVATHFFFLNFHPYLLWGKWNPI